MHSIELRLEITYFLERYILYDMFSYMRTYLLTCTTKRKFIIMTIMFLHSLWYNWHKITEVLSKTSVPQQSNRRCIWWTDGTVQDHRQAATHRLRYTVLPMWLIQHTYSAFLGVVSLNIPLEFTQFFTRNVNNVDACVGSALSVCKSSILCYDLQ